MGRSLVGVASSVNMASSAEKSPKPSEVNAGRLPAEVGGESENVVVKWCGQMKPVENKTISKGDKNLTSARKLCVTLLIS